MSEISEEELRSLKMSWSTFKDTNMRLLVEELEEIAYFDKVKLVELESMTKTTWDLYFYVNALREGLVEIEARLDRLENRK